MTKSFSYSILLKAEMLFNLDRKKISTTQSVLDADTLSLFCRSTKSSILIFEPTECHLFLKSKKQAPQVFYKKAIHKNVVIFTGNLCWSLLIIMMQV